MNILFIAPIPPPITGFSIASKALLEKLSSEHNVILVNSSKDKLVDGANSLKRVYQILRLLLKIRKNIRVADVIYFTISQSLAGNLKDLLTFFLCRKKLGKTIVHLHGGGIYKSVFKKNRLFFCMNKFFYRRIAGVIVLGESLKYIFSELVVQNRIYCVPNFSEDEIFVKKKLIINKFKQCTPLRILYMSNLVPGKGYDVLLEAFKKLGDDLRKKICIDFAGEFDTPARKTDFLRKSEGYSNVSYHGVVTGEKKYSLLKNAHIFCLPTHYYLGEGQPISILEAYAAGCVVITTKLGGIPDIFIDKENGFYVKKESYEDINRIIGSCLGEHSSLVNIAIRNNEIATQLYRKDIFTSSILKLLNKIHKDEYY